MGRPEIVDFLCLGGTGGLNHHSKIWGAKSPIFFNGVWGPRCRPDLEKQLSPAGQSCIKNPSAVSNRFGAVSDEVGRRSCFAEAAQHRQMSPERELPGPGPEASRPSPRTRSGNSQALLGSSVPVPIPKPAQRIKQISGADLGMAIATSCKAVRPC